MTERITSGLRTWTSDHFGVGDWRYESIMKLADRIDAEYKLAIANEWMRGVKYVLSEEGLAKHGLVHLPLDADGEYIHVGDEMEGVDKYDSLREVTGRVITVSFEADGLIEVAVQARNDDGKTWRRAYLDPCASLYRHHVSDTWERIIKDAREYRLNIGGSYLWKNKSDELVARCKALAGGEQ